LLEYNVISLSSSSLVTLRDEEECIAVWGRLFCSPLLYLLRERVRERERALLSSFKSFGMCYWFSFSVWVLLSVSWLFFFLKSVWCLSELPSTHAGRAGWGPWVIHLQSLRMNHWWKQVFHPAQRVASLSCKVDLCLKINICILLVSYTVFEL
jgi:hypothetical protein